MVGFIENTDFSDLPDKESIIEAFCKYPGKKSHSLSEIFIHTDMYPEEIAMRKARFTEHQIIAVLKSVEAGRTVKDVCREADISVPVSVYCPLFPVTV